VPELRSVLQRKSSTGKTAGRERLSLAATLAALRSITEALAVTADLDRALAEELPRLAAAANATRAFVWPKGGHEALFSELAPMLPYTGLFGTLPSLAQHALPSKGAVAMVAVRLERDTWGIVGFEDADATRGFDAGEMEILQVVAVVIAGVVRRLAAERAAILAETRFRDLSLAPSDWFWEQNADLRFTFISPRQDGLAFANVENAGGLTRRESIADSATLEAWERHDADLRARRPFEDFRCAVPLTDGRMRVASLSGRPFYDEKGRFAGYRGVGRDITDLVATERRAIAAETLLRNAIDALGDGLVVYDADWRLVAHNKSFVEFFPHLENAGDLRGKHITEMRALSENAGLNFKQAELTKGLAGRRDEPWIDEVTLPDGRTIVMRNYPTEGGGWVGIRTDVTANRRHEAELRHAKELAEAANRAKSSFLANMSHELRTPLNAVIGFSELLKNEIYGPLGSDRYREYAADIHSSGLHLLELINDVLDMSRIETGKLALSLEEIAPASVADDVIRLMHVEAARKRIELENAISPEALKVSADRRAFRQILFNLVSNAIKFTPDGGRVTMSGEADGALFRIAVTDTGIGIPAADLPRLARPFEQVANAMTRNTHGSGLGLAISKALAELQGGRLAIESEIGRGTTVSLWLPRAGV